MSRQKPKAVDSQTRTLVLTRSGYKCERCYGRLDEGYGFSVHHRLPRGMGGTKGREIHQASYLLVLCGSGVTGCHGWVEVNRTQALTLGLLIYRIDKGYEIPFMDIREKWWILDNDGQKVSVATFRLMP